MNLVLRAEDLAFVRAEVRRPVAVELDAVAEVDELELVQPPGVHLDVQAKQNAQRCVAFDLDVARAPLTTVRVHACAGRTRQEAATTKREA